MKIKLPKWTFIPILIITWVLIGFSNLKFEGTLEVILALAMIIGVPYLIWKVFYD